MVQGMDSNNQGRLSYAAITNKCEKSSDLTRQMYIFHSFKPLENTD